MLEFQVTCFQTEMPCRFVDDDGIDWWLRRLHKYPSVRIDKIGKSRGGRPLYGISIGDQADSVITITAGAHADEPAGPMAAMILAETLARGRAKTFTPNRKTFYICPQVNPDGAEANREWFAPVPDLETYLRNVKREGPGDDIEFGYPGGGKESLRPENQAVADYFSSAPQPASEHISLHSMAFASGAWFLLNSEAAYDDEMREYLTEIARTNNFKLHDMQRSGDKGFTRIAPGICTTPDSRAMAAHFEKLNDPETAAKFHFSSMEWAEARNPMTMCMVTELPMFALEHGYDADSSPADKSIVDIPTRRVPRPGSSALEKFRDELKPLLAKGDFTAAVKVSEKYDLAPVPFAAQVKGMVHAVAAFLKTGEMIREKHDDCSDEIE